MRVANSEKKDKPNDVKLVDIMNSAKIVKQMSSMLSNSNNKGLFSKENTYCSLNNSVESIKLNNSKSKNRFNSNFNTHNNTNSANSNSKMKYNSRQVNNSNSFNQPFKFTHGNPPRKHIQLTTCTDENLNSTNTSNTNTNTNTNPYNVNQSTTKNNHAEILENDANDFSKHEPVKCYLRIKPFLSTNNNNSNNSFLILDNVGKKENSKLKSNLSSKTLKMLKEKEINNKNYFDNEIKDPLLNNNSKNPTSLNHYNSSSLNTSNINNLTSNNTINNYTNNLPIEGADFLIVDNRTLNFKEEKFNFNKIFSEESTQLEIWNTTTKHLVEDFLCNFKSGLLFAYGISNSGKTYTIFGEANNQGILPLTLTYIFQRLVQLKAFKKDLYENLSLYCSFVEIYNEEIIDLLNPTSNESKVQLREKDKRFILTSKH